MKLLILCSLLSLLQTLTAVALIDISESEWQLFKVIHKKTYRSLEHEAFRRKIFIENTVMINTHNKEFAQGRHSFRLAINEYADLLNHEFRSQRNGYKMSLKANVSASEAVSFVGPNDDLQLPKVVDWRDNGAVTPVKNQGQCGSCWSFSATGSLEGQHYRKTGKLVSLSEQNLVDCSTSVGNDGCDGGLMDLAFKWIKQNGGIDTESSYPYKAEDGTCHYEAADRGATDKGYVDITKDSEHDLKKAVATIGPISVAIDASGPKFQFYSEGVYVDECSSEQLDHGVLVVGYGKDEDTGMDYWLVKNSWGEEWGDQGYIKMARNHDNMCGIASSASYPLV